MGDNIAYGLINGVKNNVGSDADTSSASGSVHAKLKDLKASSVISRIQRGATSITNSTSPVNVTITSVTTSKSVTNLLTSLSASGASSDFEYVKIALTSSTNLQIVFDGSISSATTISVSWEVIEYV